jgi:transposase
MFTFLSKTTGVNMLIKNLFEKALAIENPWYIKNIEFNVEAKQLDIHIDFRKGSVFNYVDETTGEIGDYKAYDTEQKSWRHLNFFEHKCYLHCRTPRIKLDSGKIRLISPPWSGIMNGFTLLFEALVLQLCTQMPVEAVSRIVSESDGKLWRLLEKYVAAIRSQEDFSLMNTLGIDETSRAKFHEYVTLFVDLVERRTVFITAGKSNKTVKEFVDDLEQHQGSREQIENVSCDMSPAFIKGVEENLPNAEITFDKFHIMKIINEAVDQVRREEAKQQDILKGYRFLFLKNYSNLTPKQKAELAQLQLSNYKLKSIRALHIRENFQQIYRAETVEAFEHLLQKWYFWATHSRLNPIIDAAHTIKKHWDGVVNWKKSQINNGILEGLNSLIQAVKSRARGFRTVKYFIIMAYLVTADLDFSCVNKYVKTCN